jgi:peptidoglycan hydrolase-like protein with peptidoglycan-binding domain
MTDTATAPTSLTVNVPALPAAALPVGADDLPALQTVLTTLQGTSDVNVSGLISAVQAEIATLTPPAGADPTTAIKSLQAVLSAVWGHPIPTSGVFDEATVTAVTAVQGVASLPATGDVDTATWQYILTGV